MNEHKKKGRRKIQCGLCNYKKEIESDCPCCNGTGVDERKWYMLVGWDGGGQGRYGYWKYTSDWDEVQLFISQGMELYGCSDEHSGIYKLQREFYDKGGWFYR